MVVNASQVVQHILDTSKNLGAFSTHHRNIPDKTRGKHIMKTLFAKSHRLSTGVDPLIHHENRVHTQKNSDKM